MNRRNFLLSPGALALSLASPGLLAQSDWPTKPIHFYVGFAPGGASDVLARLLGAEISRQLGVPVIVENKPGQAGSLAADAVAKAPSDGYSILLGTPGMQVINPLLYDKLPYDADRDLTPLTMLVRIPNLMVINASLGITNVQELVAYAKKNPGRLNYASNGNGSASHLAMELFKLMSQTDIVHVPYKGSGPAIIDLKENRVQIGMDSFTTLHPQVKAGSLNALGVSSLQRIPWFPEIPAVAETVSGYEGSSFIYVAATGGIAPSQVERYNGAFREALNAPVVAARLKELGMTPAPGSSQEMRDVLLEERRKWGPVIKAAGLKGAQ